MVTFSTLQQPVLFTYVLYTMRVHLQYLHTYCILPACIYMYMHDTYMYACSFMYMHVQRGNITETLTVCACLYPWCGFKLSLIYSLPVPLDPPPTTCTLHVVTCTCMSIHCLSCWIPHPHTTCTPPMLAHVHMYMYIYAGIFMHYSTVCVCVGVADIL